MGQRKRAAYPDIKNSELRNPSGNYDKEINVLFA